MKRFATAMLGLSLCACTQGSASKAPDWVGRELRPPRSDVQVGALYFAREKIGTSGPVNLERLCDINLSKYNVTPSEIRVADIDLTNTIEASGALEGIKNYFFNAKIDGNFSDYFEYKLTNVIERSITGAEAEHIFGERAFQKDCTGWRTNIADQNWAKMQILSVRIGDIVFKQKDNAGGSAEINAKISVATPKLTSALKANYNLAMNGKGLVFSFSSLPRN